MRGRGLTDVVFMMTTFPAASTIMIGVVDVHSRGVPHGRQYVSGSSAPAARSSGRAPPRALWYCSNAHGCRGGSSFGAVHRSMLSPSACCQIPAMSSGVLAGCAEVCADDIRATNTRTTTTATLKILLMVYLEGATRSFAALGDLL